MTSSFRCGTLSARFWPARTLPARLCRPQRSGPKASWTSTGPRWTPRSSNTPHNTSPITAGGTRLPVREARAAHLELRRRLGTEQTCPGGGGAQAKTTLYAEVTGLLVDKVWRRTTLVTSYSIRRASPQILRDKTAILKGNATRLERRGGSGARGHLSSLGPLPTSSPVYGHRLLLGVGLRVRTDHGSLCRAPWRFPPDRGLARKRLRFGLAHPT